jgi:hypothetical protein
MTLESEGFVPGSGAQPQRSAEVFNLMLEEAGLHAVTLSASAAWSVFLDFACVSFAVPQTADADGLLYQFGIFTFSGEPRFHLDLTRQFMMPDEDEFLQFHCDMQFSPTADLQALGSHDESWWPDGDQELTTWAGEVAAGPEWVALAGKTPVLTEVYCDKI